MTDLEWFDYLKNVLKNCNGENPLHIFGYGNPLRRDDGVGLYIVSKLLKRVKRIPSYISIHSTSSSIEKELEKLPKTSTIIIIDAAYIDISPGSIIFTKFEDVKYYSFDTHNVPLKIILEINSLLDNAYLLGVVPYDISVGEGLTVVVKNSADEIIEKFSQLLSMELYSKSS